MDPVQKRQLEIIQELRRRISECEVRRRYLISYVKKLQESYLNKKISHDQYNYSIYKQIEGKSIPERIEEYEGYVWFYKNEIRIRKKYLKKRIFSILIPLLIVVFLIFSLLVLRPMFLG